MPAIVKIALIISNLIAIGLSRADEAPAPATDLPPQANSSKDANQHQGKLTLSVADDTDGDVFVASKVASKKLPAYGAPVTTLYDSSNNLILSMPRWENGPSVISMSYGSRAGLHVLRARPKDPYEQFSINFDADLEIGNVYFRTEQGVMPYKDFGPSGIDEDNLRMLQYGYEGTSGKLSYGAKYALAGSEYDDFLFQEGKAPKKDRETKSIWVKRSITDRMSLRFSREELRKDLDRGPEKTHYVDLLSGLTSSLVLMQKPYLGTSLWVKKGTRNSGYVPNGKAGYRGSVSNYGASLYLQNNWGSHGITTTYSDAFDREQLRQSHYVSRSIYSNLYATDAVSLGIAAGISESELESVGYRWFGKYTSQSAWASYKPSHDRYKVTMSTYFDGYRTRDGTTDYSGFYSDLTLSFHKLFRREMSMPLAFTVEYANYTDEVYPSANYDGITFWIQVGRSIGSVGRPAFDEYRFGRPSYAQ